MAIEFHSRVEFLEQYRENLYESTGLIVTNYEQKYQEALLEFRRFCDGLDRGDAYRDGQTKLNINLKGNVVS